MASNVTIIEGVYEAFGRGDVEAVLGAFDEKIEWEEPDSVPYENQVGPQAVGENVFARVVGDIEGFAVTPSEILDAGDVVVGIGRYTGTGAATGIKLDTEFAHVWRLRDGKITGFRTYTDTKRWLEALGVD